MTDSDWWAGVVQARAGREDLLPRRVRALRKGGQLAAPIHPSLEGRR
jgi:hypothetical protein